MDEIISSSEDKNKKVSLLFPFIISVVIIVVLIVVLFFLVNAKTNKTEPIVTQKVVVTPPPTPIASVSSEKIISYKDSEFTFEMKDVGKALDSQSLSIGSCSWDKGYSEKDLLDCNKFGQDKYHESKPTNININGLSGCAVVSGDCGMGSCNQSYTYNFGKNDRCFEIGLLKSGVSTCEAFDDGPEKTKCEQYQNVELPALIKSIENSFKITPVLK